MKRSTDRILTTHAGSLPRPADLIELYRNDAPDADLLPRLRSSVAEVVQQQRDAGVDVVNDGEYGKASRAAVDYGAWWSYVYGRIEGFEVRDDDPAARGYGPHNSKDRRVFKEFYDSGAPMSGGQSGGGTQNTATARLAQLVCTGPVKYTGHALVQRDIDNLKAALNGTSVEEAFLPAVSPATLQIISNAHYASKEDYTWALAEAIREEYRAIVDAGFVLQIDDPALVDLYDWWFSANDDIAGFRKWAAFQVEAVNHALEGIPEDRVRFHICWGSWHGPHSTDVPLKDVVDLLLKVKAQAYSSKRATCATSTNGRSGATWSSCRRARFSSPASSATPPTCSSTPSWSPTASCSTPTRRPRERHRRHRLRPRRPRAPAARLGQAARAERRRGAGVEAVVG